VQDPTNEQVEYLYDAATGQLIHRVDRFGVTSLGYDIRGLLTFVQRPEGQATAFAYDGHLLLQESQSGLVPGTAGQKVGSRARWSER
jgi:YD repeat-containing protein